MAHFTQLGLSAKSESKNEEKTQKNSTLAQSTKRLNGKHKTATLVGSLIATSLVGVFLLESGCSKGGDKAATTIAPPVQPTVSQPSAPPLALPMPAAQQPVAKKSRQKKLVASTYNNSAFGVSFRYPKYGMLQEGEKANLELDGIGPVDMNFVQPGGTPISAVILPRKRFAGTDFNAAFFTASVNSKLTAEECEQFAFPETGNPEGVQVPTSKTKVGNTEFRSIEGFASEEKNEAELKYYHVYQNGSCYEFALGLETALNPDSGDDETVAKPVNRNEVFRRLNWMLSTVKIQPVEAPKAATAEVAAGTNAPAAAPTITSEAH